VTGAGTAIAVIDTGIDYTHPFLGGGFGPGYKVVGGTTSSTTTTTRWTPSATAPKSPASRASPFDFDGHHYQGVAPQAKLLALRVDAANDPSPTAASKRRSSGSSTTSRSTTSSR
jgi:subtilisin family serine protease